MLEFGSLGLHQNTQNLAQDVGEAKGIGNEGHRDVQGLEWVQWRDVPIGNGGHCANAEIHCIQVLPVPWLE